MRDEAVVKEKAWMAELNASGDTKVMWDSDNRDETEAAKSHFAAMKLKGFSAYRVKKDGSQGEVMKDFDPSAEAIILAPMLKGG